jgi:hypothetical protein
MRKVIERRLGTGDTGANPNPETNVLGRRYPDDSRTVREDGRRNRGPKRGRSERGVGEVPGGGSRPESGR